MRGYGSLLGSLPSEGCASRYVSACLSFETRKGDVGPGGEFRDVATHCRGRARLHSGSIRGRDGRRVSIDSRNPRPFVSPRLIDDAKEVPIRVRQSDEILSFPVGPVHRGSGAQEPFYLRLRVRCIQVEMEAILDQGAFVR